ncbi:MAG: S-layer homology domain-containing protein [Gudongella sp.]|nr:S-layer homology domain-containing protein [Gudongella sp.]
MKINKKSLLVLAVALIMMLSQFVYAEDNYAVKITGELVENELMLTLDDLKAMPEEAQIEEEYIYNSKAGEKTAMVKGVSLAYALEEAGMLETATSISLTASDNYPIDPQTVEDVLNADLMYVIAYEVDGEAIDNDDNPENEEVVVYRKVKEDGEFGTVFKMVVEIAPIIAEDIVEEEEEATEPVVTEPIMDAGFVDITEEYLFAEDAINTLASKEIINGMGDSKYMPEGNLTRAQFAKIMVLSLDLELVEYKGGFEDVAADKWYATYVQTAFDNGIFKGMSETTFAPDGELTRSEIATVAGRAAVTAGKVEQTKQDKFTMDKSNFSDKEMVPEWAANEVAWLEAEAVFKDIATDNFMPTQIVNRAEAAAVVYNTLFTE